MFPWKGLAFLKGDGRNDALVNACHYQTVPF